MAYAKQMVAKSIYPNGESAPSAATPAPVPAATAVEEAEGYKLFLSSGNATGYKGVYKQTNGKFIAQYTDTALNKLMYIGIYDTAVNASGIRKANGG